MKKLLLIVLTALTSTVFAFAVACNKSPENSTAATLVDFTDETVNVEYGSLYTVADYVYDTDGGCYALTASVADGDGTPLTATDSFVVEDTSYTVVYTAQFGGENKSRTVTLNAYVKPLIAVDKTEITRGLGVLPYTIPEITVTDPLYDSETRYTKEIWYLGKKGEEKTAYNGTDATWMPDKIGTYILKILATNAQGITNEEEVRFHIQTPVFEFIPTEDRASTFYNGTKTGEYIASADVPTTYLDADSVEQPIANPVGFAGDVSHVRVVNDNRLFVKMGLSAVEYEHYINVYSSVTFSYLIVGTVSFTNADSKKDENGNLMYNGLFSRSGASVAKNQWHTVTVPYKEFIASMRVCDTDDSTLFLMHNWQNGSSVEFYLGDIKLNKYCVDFIPSALTQGSVSFSGNNHTYGYVKNADIPTECEWVDNNSTTQTATIDNTLGYTGDAIKITNVYNGNYWYVNMDYTTSEYKTMQDKYASVTIYYMLAMEVGKSESWGLYGEEGSRGYNGALSLANASMERHKWLKAELTFEQFLMAMEKGNATAGVDDHRLFLGAPGWHSSCGLSLYLGEIKLVEKTA